jgi:hypothetical protein
MTPGNHIEDGSTIISRATTPPSKRPPTGITIGLSTRNMAPSPLHAITNTTTQPTQCLPPPDPPTSDQDPDSNSPNAASPVSIVQDVHTSPDDANAVLDSGAMMTTAPRRHLTINPEWKANIRPAPPGTAIRYGNMETEPVKVVSHIGSYPLSIVPNRYRTALVCVHDIVSAGHVVTFTNHETIISDVGGASHAYRTLENGEYPYICSSASLTFLPSTHSTTHNNTKTTFDNQPPDP